MNATPALNAPAARRLLANVGRDLRAQLKKTKDGDPLEELLARSSHVISVALIPSQPDGYPSTTPGNGNSGGCGGRFISVPDELGEPDRVPVTSTEQAVLNDHTTPDKVNAIAREVLAELATVATSLTSLSHALDRFDHLRRTDGQVADRQCYVTKHVLKLGWEEEWEPWRTSDLNGALSEPFPVCKWVYWFHRDNGRLPTSKEALTHIERNVARSA